MDAETRTYSGGCHCETVRQVCFQHQILQIACNEAQPQPPSLRFEFDGPSQIIAWDCNCSICAMKRNTHVIVPGTAFRLAAGAEALSEYTVSRF